ncbi:unnamed protein product, partial [Ectocarpus fasciculatus]
LSTSSAFSGDEEPCSGEGTRSPTASCLWLGEPSGKGASSSLSPSTTSCCCGTKTGGVERAGTGTSSSFSSPSSGCGCGSKTGGGEVGGTGASSFCSTLSVGGFISCVGRIRALHESSLSPFAGPPAGEKGRL